MATAKKAPAKKAAVTVPARPLAKKATSPKATAPAAKKATAKKAAMPEQAEAPAWSTIHVFGYGESQVIGSQANGKVPNGQLKALAPLYAALAKQQQEGTRVTLEGTHALNIFNGSFIDYRPRGRDNMGQRFAWADVDKKTINKLADELMGKVPEDDGQGRFMARFMNNSAQVQSAAKKQTTPANAAKRNVAPLAKKKVAVK